MKLGLTLNWVLSWA